MKINHSNKEPWVGSWWVIHLFESSFYAVKQETPVTGTSYNKDTHETGWINISEPAYPITISTPGGKDKIASLKVEDLPFPPLEYLQNLPIGGIVEIELTNDSYYIYD